MALTPPPSLPDDRRSRLAAELRRARSMSGLSGRDLAQKIDISQSKISRIESGSTFPSLPEVRAWAEAVQAPDETYHRLMALTEEAHTAVARWRGELRSRPHLQDDIARIESRAARILTFQPSVVPGLLQTAEYARRLFEMFQEPAYEPDHVAAAVAARVERQLSLHDPTKTFDFLITEAALRWRPSTRPLLAAQTDKISTLSTLDNVAVGVLPLSGQAVAPYTHAFTVYEPASDGDEVVVNVEMIHANIQLSDVSDVGAFQRRWSTLHESALHGDEARSFLNGLITELRRSSG
jgi:transcriptional regulator with XRE-family HTH domain